MTKVLVPIDLQPKADIPALLLHMTQDDIDKAQQEQGRSTLVNEIKELEGAKCTYRAHVLIGDAATKIVRVAKSEQVRTIVIGTRGMGALGNLALGSTATKVIHLAEVPVTLVK